MGKNILEYNTVSLIEDDLSVEIIDQTLLPGKVELVRLKKAKEMWDAIFLLKVRGAPAIGVFAAYSLYVLSVDISENVSDVNAFLAEFQKNKEYLNSSRPTAVNLSWALNRMEKVCRKTFETADNNTESQESEKRLIEQCVRNLHDEACLIQKEDIDMCKKIGECGLQFIKPGFGILTHCNAGQLATSKFGTATAPIYLAHEKGYSLKVYADETRPLLQGARLTAFELASAGIDVTLLCDNMSGALMRSGKVNAVFVGCDRVAANGDVANKIGTSVVATMAKHYGIPFYVCAPSSTIDLNTPTGNDIKIEQRPSEEVTELWYEKRMAPENIKVFNPAFDVTDYNLITAIITEKGLFKPEL